MAISLLISGNQFANGGFNPLLQVNNPPTDDDNRDQQPYISGSDKVYIIEHKPGYIKYTLVFCKARSFNAQRPGILIIGMYIPKDQRLSNGRSPYDLLTEVFTTFLANGMTHLQGDYYEYKEVLPNEATFTPIIDPYQLDAATRRYIPMMRENSHGVVITHDIDKTRKLFTDSQYDQFADYQDITIAEEGQPSANATQLNIPIPRPHIYRIYLNNKYTGRAISDDPNDEQTIPLPEKPYHRKTIPFIQFTLSRARSDEGLRRYIQIDDDKEEVIITFNDYILEKYSCSIVLNKPNDVSETEIKNKIKLIRVSGNDRTEVPLTNGNFTLEGSQIADLFDANLDDNNYTIAKCNNLLPTEKKFWITIDRKEVTLSPVRTVTQDYLRVQIIINDDRYLGFDKHEWLTVCISHDDRRFKETVQLNKVKRNSYSAYVFLNKATWDGQDVTVSFSSRHFIYYDAPREYLSPDCELETSIRERKTLKQQMRTLKFWKRYISSFIIALIFLTAGFYLELYLGGMGGNSDSSYDEVGRGYIQYMDAADFSFDSLATIQAWVEQDNNAADTSVIDSCRKKMELLKKVQQALKDHEVPTLYDLKSALSPNQQAIVDSFYHRTHDENKAWKSETIHSEFNNKTFSSIQNLDYQPTSQTDEVSTSTDGETQSVPENQNPDKTTYNNYLQQLQGTTFIFSDLAAMKQWINEHSTLDKDKKLSKAIACYQKIYYNLQHENFENISLDDCTDKQKNIIDKLKNVIDATKKQKIKVEIKDKISGLTFSSLQKIIDKAK